MQGISLGSVLFKNFFTVSKGGEGIYMVVVSSNTDENTRIKLSMLQGTIAKNLASADTFEWREKYKANTIILFDSDGTEIKRLEETVSVEQTAKWIRLYQNSMAAAQIEEKPRIFRTVIPAQFQLKK